MSKRLKTRKRNRKLLFQVSLIIIAMFILSYAFTVVTDFFMTRNTYLSAKREILEHDIIRFSKELSEESDYKYLFDYMTEHPDELRRPLTEEEKAFDQSDEFGEIMYQYYIEGLEFEKQTPEIQMFIMRRAYQSLGADFQALELFNFERMLYYVIKDKDSIYLVANSDDNWNALDGDSGSDIQKLEYESSGHSAIKDILDGKLSEPGTTLFEEYYDKQSGKYYYNAYTGVYIDGKPVFYICLQYNWTEFHNELFDHMRNSLIAELIIVAVLNSLLMLFMYNKAISPLSKLKQSIEKYMDDKNSVSVVDKMDRIKTRNEVGAVADRFSELAVEIDRYTKENLKLCSEKERIAAELDLAAKIQSNMIPQSFPNRPEFDLFAVMDPAKEVGGDFYDFFFIDEDHLALVIADVSGKGVPAALFMMSSKILLIDHTMMGGTPAEILDKINKQVCSNNTVRMFVTVWLGILEISTGKLTSSSAGHEYPFIKTNGRYEMFKDKHGTPIGTFKKAKYKNEELTLKKGDSIFVYTDGVSEAADTDNVLFGRQRTQEALNTDLDALPKNVLKNVRSAVDGFIQGAPQFDDLTMLCLRYNGCDEQPEQS